MTEPAVDFESQVVDDALAMMVEWVKSQPDDETRAQAAHWLQIKKAKVFYEQTTAELRAHYVRVLYAEGYGFSEGEIAQMLGVSRARINQITRR